MKSTIKRSLLILSIVCILLSVLAVPALAEDTVIYAAPSAAGTADGSSWANAMTLDAAWAAATSGTKIFLKSGTYNRTVTLTLKDGVSVFGGFAGTEASETERDLSDRDSNGIIEPWEFTNETLFTGSVRFFNYATNADAVVDGITMTTTASTSGGSVIALYTGNVLQNSEVKNSPNAARGVVYLDGGKLLSSYIHDNVTNSDRGVVSIYYNNYSPATVSHCRIEYNKAQYGGGIYSRSSQKVSITNNLIIGNEATKRGGGVYLGSGSNPPSDAWVINNTIMNNIVSNPSYLEGGDGDGSGIFAEGGDYIYNNVITGNTGPTGCKQVANSNKGGNFHFQNNAIQGLAGLDWTAVSGTVINVNNIDLNGSESLFSAGYIPVAGGLLENAGDKSLYPNYVVNSPELKDLKGDMRVQGGQIDIGAYEFNTPAADPQLELSDADEPYDSDPHELIATTTPEGIPVTYTYNGSATPPTEIGNYVVVATVDGYFNDIYYYGTAEAVLNILELHTITATAGDNGTISPAGVVYVLDGYDQSFTITPNAGYIIDAVTVDDVEVNLTDGVYTFENVTENHTINATFKQISLRIEDNFYATLAEAVAAAQDGDTITLLVDLSDQTVSLTKPNVGYTLDLNQKTLEMKPTGYLLNVPNEKTITIKNGTMNVDGTNLPQYSSSCEYLIGLTNASSALNLDNVDFTVTNVSKPDDRQRDWYVFNLDAGSVNLTNGTKLSFSDLAKAFYAPAIQTAEINVKDSEISFEGILNMCFHCDRVMLDNGKITVTDSENAGVFVHSGLTATNNSVVTIDNVYQTFSGSDMAHGECLVMDATSSITETNTEAVSITGDVTVPSGADISLDSDLEIYGTAAIADGRYKGTIAKRADAASISITGGTFSVDPSEYVASGYVVNMVSGKYVVSKQPPTSGGGSTPPTVTVPVSSDSGSANVSASISGTAVTVSITDQDLSQVIASAGNTGNVVIDVSGLNNVTSAVIPSKVITAVNGAEDATGLTVALPGGSVGLDSDALAAVAAAAGGADVTMSVETVDTSKLSESQQAVLGNQISNAIVVDVSIMAQGTAISSFDGGTVTISVPYEPEEGTDTSKLVVWYLADDGTISPVEGAYDPATKSFVFKTSHLSTYALVSFPFEDVTAGSWYYGNVAYVFNNNLFNGTSSSTFSPDDTMTRAMLMTVLARMAGQDTAVEDGVWYEKGMNWAVENGISDGTNPEGSITREQLVTMLYRYAGSPEASGDLSAFSDADKVDGYATLAMQWAVGKGLINGMGDGTLAPRDTATRAQVAAILMRFCENIIA